MVINEELQLDVLPTLDWNPGVKVISIGINGWDDTVRLSGEVSSYVEQMARYQMDRQESETSYPSQPYLVILMPVNNPAARSLPSQADPAAAQWTGTPTSIRQDGFDITLSAREVEVLSLIARGQSNQEIAKQLCLALNTVKRHAYNIYAKLDAKNRTQAVSKARRLGIIV